MYCCGYTNNFTDEENTGASAVAAVAASATITATAPDSLNTAERMISPSVMAKYLQDELKASEVKHCDTCLCATRDLTVLADTAARHYSVGTQTQLQGDANNALCLRCNSNLNSPSRNNSPYIMKLIRSNGGDSIVSDTKSSQMSDSNNELAGVTGKRDDLTVNPILGHHRLCDRKAKVSDTDGDGGGGQPDGEMRPIKNDGQNRHKLSPMVLRPKVIVETLLDVSGSGKNGHKFADAERFAPADGNDATTTGSTHSLWSKTSSNTTNNADGAKMFETFNRNLIKSIKVSTLNKFCLRFNIIKLKKGRKRHCISSIAVYYYSCDLPG